MKYSDFQNQLRDLLNHIYDYPAVAKHPLSELLAVRGSASRADSVRQVIAAAIEQLRPDRNLPPDSPAWRPYQILKRRFLDGLSPQEVAAEMAISERQLRRDQARALDVLAQHLWEQVVPRQEIKSLDSLSLNPEQLAIPELCQSVQATLAGRFEQAQAHLHMEISDDMPPLYADRTLLRHLLITLLSQALENSRDGKIHLNVSQADDGVLFRVHTQNRADRLSPLPPKWIEHAQKMGVRWRASDRAADGQWAYEIIVPPATAPVILIIDDQPPALRMFQRYMSQTAFKVVGIQDPREALDAVQHWQPALIVLDVMMPRMDGWELLQSLKTNEQTRRIPVVICSAWEEPELAFSLGAADFLKKPVTRADFLAMLKTIGLL